MANIKDLKKRIRSTKSTLKITSAMKLVSAAKLARAQLTVLNSRHFMREFETTMRTVAAFNEGIDHRYLQIPSDNRALMLVISSDRGLCGSVNTLLIKKVKAFLAENSTLEVKLVFIGRKAYDGLKLHPARGHLYSFAKSEPTVKEMRSVVQDVLAQFMSGEFSRIFVAYNEFGSAIRFVPTVKQIAPLNLTPKERSAIERTAHCDFTYDDPVEVVLKRLIPDTSLALLYNAVRESIASEHGSRMSAMDNATKNCTEMIRKLTLNMNKLRQARITTELTEVVSGAESLNG